MSQRWPAGRPEVYTASNVGPLSPIECVTPLASCATAQTASEITIKQASALSGFHYEASKL